MALPTPAKSWTIDPCNRIVHVTIPQVVGDIMLAVKNHFILAPGVTVKGSCNGAAAAMDGVDRWVTSANVQTRNNGVAGAQSWIILDCANAGGGELLMTYNAASQTGFAFYYSPGGLYVLAGTATHKPTATDEVTIRLATGIVSAGTADRLWSAWYATDGSAFKFAVAEAGVWTAAMFFQLAVSRVEAPATFSPALVAGCFGSQVGYTGAMGVWGTTGPKARANGGAGAVNIDGFFGAEGAQTGIAATVYPNVSELQGGGQNIYPVSVHSNTATARGAVANLTDIWVTNPNGTDGDTAPNDASRQFIQVVDFLWKWDGSAVAMA